MSGEEVAWNQHTLQRRNASHAAPLSPLAHHALGTDQGPKSIHVTHNSPTPVEGGTRLFQPAPSICLSSSPLNLRPNRLSQTNTPKRHS
ncbi:hypothetical protein FRC08_018461 [Ceratobasidium sp. 394]|nr:hypothetical protein FRC08_018461 [Ceratobasidium sp. 394]KAG9098403.1 hypothetical protein FS749_003896 [Ceratobasidium sp. UAMH 11750]